MIENLDKWLNKHKIDPYNNGDKWKTSEIWLKFNLRNLSETQNLKRQYRK